MDILKIPMEKNDAKASTIGEYLITLLATVWDEEEGFSGKRPFGNSGWKSDVYAALIKANAVQGKLDEEGYVESIDRKKANSIVEEAIHKIYRTIAAN